ncbi:MAG TPA: Ig-like domain-containing protein [Spirochaetales bacterium]|nr:Ig-like domain-containing protein [Spirochaetales bacterium]
MPLAPRSFGPRGARRALLALALCLAALPAAAMGGKEPPREKASGLEDWEHGFDLSGLPAGKYNIVVEGKDKAGNVSIAGPINVYVDPASDLPRVSIVNPLPLMRVGGDLNVVGTCVDDDGVARVEVSVDGGEFVPAEGGEFWSLYLGTKDLADGKRIIAARGVDINGLSGPEVRVSFNLDRAKPLASVAAPEAGALVAGAIRLEGTVSDANGVASLEISMDGGSSFSKVELKKSKEAAAASFAYSLDTRKLPDGPRVVWMRSVDGVGSKGSAAFLLVVDNTKPAIEILRPAKEKAVNGRFALAGAVRDAVGVRRLSYEFGGAEKGEIELTPGNPYFVKELDSGALKGDKAEIVLLAEDRIGNVTRLALAPKVDRKADKPVVRVSYPASGGQARPGESVWGAIADDDGAAMVRFSFDGGAPSELPASEHFAIPLPELASGRHVVSITAVDVEGAAGDPLVLPFVMDRGPGAVSFLRVSGGAAKQAAGKAAPAEGARDYASGVEVALDSGSLLEGRVESANPPLSAEWSVAGGAPRKLELSKAAEPGAYSFRLPLDRSLPYGFAPIEVKVADGFGNSYSGRALVYATNLGAIREDSGFRFDDPRIGEGGRVVLSAAEPLLGAFYREELASLRLEPATDIVAASFDGRVVSLAVLKEGATPPLRLVGKTKRGHDFEAGPFSFACDSIPPRIEIESPAEGAWHSGRFEAKGRVVDSGGLAKLLVRSSPGAEARELKVGSDGRFSFFVEPAASAAAAGGIAPAEAGSAGPSYLEVEAVDSSGNAARAYRSYGVDAKAPALRFLSPEAGAQVSGPEDIAAVAEDASGLASVEYAADGASFTPVERRGNAFIHRADLAANPKAAYRVTDRAGNAAVLRPEVKAVPAAKPLPAADSVSVEPEAGEARLELAGAAGTGAAARKLSLLLPALSEEAFSALGLAEGKEAPERFSVRLLASGALSLKGKVASEGKVKALSLSLDGGASWAPLFQAKDAKSILPEAAVALNVDTAKLPDGEARLVLKVEGEAGGLSYVPLYLLVDNRAPEAAILAPEASVAALPGPYPLVLKISDPPGPSSGAGVTALTSGGGAFSGVAAAELSLGADKKALPVAEGGSYYAFWADPEAAAAAAKGAALAVWLSARDAAGNAAAATRKLAYDAAADAPRITLSLPAPAAVAAPAPGAKPAPAATERLVLSPGDAIAGLAADDDGPAELRLSFDGGEALVFPAGAFALALPALSPGRHSLKLEARDQGGKSAEAKRELLVRGPAPSFSGVEAGAASGRKAWLPGLELALASGSALSGRVEAPNGLSSLEYSVNGGAAQKALLGKAEAGGAAAAALPFSAALPASLPYERFVVELVARDLSGLETRRRYDFHAVLPSLPGAPPADDAEGLRFHDARVSAEGEALRLLLKPGERLSGRFNGRPLASLAVEPSVGFLSASFEGASVSLEAKAEGLSGPPYAAAQGALRLVAVTVDGDRFEWGPFSLAVDAASPSLALDSPADASWTKGPTRIAGRAEDPNGVVAVELSVNGGPRTRLEPRAAAPAATPPAAPAAPAASAAKAPAAKPAAAPAPAPSASAAPAPKGPLAAYTFDAELPLAEAEDGIIRLELFARDSAGRESSLTRFVYKDSQPPTLSLVLPPPGEAVNGTTTLVGEAADSGRLASASFSAAKGAAAEEVLGLSVFSRTVDLARVAFPLPEGYGFAVADRAGNVAVLSPELLVDKEKDKPVVEIAAPAELEVIRADFFVSGTAFDDDGVAAIEYRLDGGEWVRVEPKGAGFSVPRTLAETADNEHLVEAFAKDLYGVKGDTVARRFRVSKEEPLARMTSPSIAKPQRGLVELAGEASDANGVASVRLSFDNATAFNLGSGAESWRYPLDTRVLADGLHAIAAKPLDKYDTEGFYATLLNVDNTPPRAELSLPADGASYSGTLPLSGRVSDNVRLDSARVEVAPIGQGRPPVLVVDLGQAAVVRRELDVSALPPGGYTVRLVAKDRADNETLASRDVVLKEGRPADMVEILFPVEGEELSGAARLYGRAAVSGGVSAATILVDGADVGTAAVDARGWFAFDLPADKLEEGTRRIVARAAASDGRLVESRAETVSWKRLGPWVSVDSLPAGAYLPYRPYLSGGAGYLAAAPAAGDKAAQAAFKKTEGQRRVTRVELSLDNGRTFLPAKGGERWKFRLETQDYPEGSLHVIVRASFGDGSTAVAKTILALDKTPPEVALERPQENGRYNAEIRAAGVASDESGLESVGLALRKGDKRGYELPAFIQGLYIDGHFLGATYYDIGAGLSFFQDNVKLQVMTGMAPEEGRFGGSVMGAKLLANIAYLPANFLLGPDWNFLSASLALGANFSYFSQSASGSGLILGAVVAQLEFPKITVQDWSFLKKYSFYTEGQAWFVSSDVQGGILFRLSFGARLGLF